MSQLLNVNQAESMIRLVNLNPALTFKLFHNFGCILDIDVCDIRQVLIGDVQDFGTLFSGLTVVLCQGNQSTNQLNCRWLMASLNTDISQTQPPPPPLPPPG